MRFLVIPALCLTAACSSDGVSADSQTPTFGDAQSAVVYGSDDRVDVYASTDVELQALARQSTVALMNPADYDASDANNVQFKAQSLKEAYSLCDGERFATDPVAAFCSGTLVADDIVLTAGHCVTNDAGCANTRFVFNYLRDSVGAELKVTADDIFACKEIITRTQSGVDFGLIRLDRSAAPRHQPAPIVESNVALSANDGVAVIGSGSGIPFKIDAGGKVRDGRATSRDYFVATTDTFGGNSGSGVYRLLDHRLVGVLVRGASDYKANGACRVVNTCSETTCRGEDSTYAWNAVVASCSTSTPLNASACPKP